MTKLSDHFTLEELTASNTAKKYALDNTPDEKQIESLTELCLNVLEPIRAVAREMTGQKLVCKVNSGYRGKALNAAVGGSSSSQHCKGEACDFEMPGIDNLQLAKLIEQSSIPFDQLILEFYTPGDPSSGWIHVSHKKDGPQRGQVLTAARVNGKTVYSNGLPDEA